MLRYRQPIIVPAMFETAEYRRAVVMAAGTDLERADELVAATLERQSVLQGTDPPEVVAVLHEAVLHRLIGTAEIMHDQLIHLAELSERPNLSIHVVPSGIGARPSPQFTLTPRAAD